jgi:hypothetical protein
MWRKSSSAEKSSMSWRSGHDISRRLIRIWVGKFEAGVFDEVVQAADLSNPILVRATTGVMIFGFVI